jgi:hypothetical protein
MAIDMLNQQVGFLGGYPLVDTMLSKSVVTSNEIYQSSNELDLDPDREISDNVFMGNALFPFFYKTQNGGISWQPIKTPFQSGIKDLDFVDENNGFVVTRNDGVFKTTDGGETWQQVLRNVFHLYWYHNVENAIDRVEFLDKNHGFAYDEGAGDGLVLETHDGGENWECINLYYRFPEHQGSEPSPFGYDIDKLIFPNRGDTGFVQTENKLFITTNKGENWEMVGEERFYSYLFFYNASIIYDYGTQKHSTDAGNTWIESEKFNTPYHFVVTGINEFYLYHSGDDFIRFNETNYYEATKLYLENYNGEEFSDLVFPTPELGIAIGREGGVWRHEK